MAVLKIVISRIGPRTAPKNTPVSLLKQLWVQMSYVSDKGKRKWCSQSIQPIFGLYKVELSTNAKWSANRKNWSPQEELHWDNIYEDFHEYEDLIEVDNKQNSNSVVQVEENATRQQEKMIKSAKQTKLQPAHFKAYSRFENNDDDDDYD